MKHTVTYEFNGQTKQKQLSTMEALLDFANFVNGTKNSGIVEITEDFVAARQLLLDKVGNTVVDSIGALAMEAHA